MGRNIISVILGVIGGSILVGLIESIGHRLYGSQVPVDTSDPDAMREFVASLPIEALLIVIVAHALGAFMAGLIASRMALNNKQAMGWIAAGVMLIFTIMVNVMIPGPMWMKIGDPLAVILLGTIGAKLGSRG